MIHCHIVTLLHCKEKDNNNVAIQQCNNLGLGYTIIEFLVVLGVIGFIAVMSFYALSSFDSSEKVRAASKKFVSDLRTLQNQAINGVRGANFWKVSLKTGTSTSNTSYSIYREGTLEANINLPQGVYYTHSFITPGTNQHICFANPNLTIFGDGQCGGCSAGTFFACNTTINPPCNYCPVSSGTTTVTFRSTSGGAQKTVVIEGSNMAITRIYEQ